MARTRKQREEDEVKSIIANTGTEMEKSEPVFKLRSI